MKKFFFLITLGLFFSLSVIGQTKIGSETAQDSILTKASEFPRN